MIFYSHHSGQLGNQLFVFAHLVANAAAHRTKLVNLSFAEYARYFSTTNDDLFCRFPERSSFIKSNSVRSGLFLVNKAILKVMRIGRFDRSVIHRIIVADLPEYQFTEENYFDLNSQIFQNLVRKKPVVLLFGRFFRDFQNFEKYQDVIRNYFTPLPELQTHVDQFINEAKKSGDILVGVHIRRGDYAQFAGGKYFFSHSQYAAKMKELQGSPIGRKVTFVVCSNEELKSEYFGGLPFKEAPGHLVKDMYILSQCDLIMGPPSSYSLWASFYGRKPLYHMRDVRIPINLDSFVMLPPHVLYNFAIS